MPLRSRAVLTVRFKDYRTDPFEIPPHTRCAHTRRSWNRKGEPHRPNCAQGDHVSHSTQGYWLSMSRGFSLPVCRFTRASPSPCAVTLRETEVKIESVASKARYVQRFFQQGDKEKILDIGESSSVFEDVYMNSEIRRRSCSEINLLISIRCIFRNLEENKKNKGTGRKSITRLHR